MISGGELKVVDTRFCLKVTCRGVQEWNERPHGAAGQQ